MVWFEFKQWFAPNHIHTNTHTQHSHQRRQVITISKSILSCYLWKNLSKYCQTLKPYWEYNEKHGCSYKSIQPNRLLT